MADIKSKAWKKVPRKERIAKMKELAKKRWEKEKAIKEEKDIEKLTPAE